MEQSPIEQAAKAGSRVGSYESACGLVSEQPNITAPVPTNKKRVAVAMSGGVDSSTTALLLMEAGYDIVGVTGWLIKSGSRCCDTGMVDAARVCEQLGIEHHAVDLREMFKAQIMDQFPKAYARAQTPLPCSVCNTVIKWGALLNYSKKLLNASYIATGHYGRVVETSRGLALARSADRSKDQSYVLWGLTMDQLRSTLLPLGDYTKDKIREIATSNKLVSADRPDSQDLCFIPKGTTTQEYLAEFLPEKPGLIIHAVTGKLLGEHKGTHNFTIGQRRGLRVSSNEVIYVTSIDPDLSVVYAGPKEALLRNELTAGAANWIMEEPPVEPFEALAKIRYNSEAVPATVIPMPEGQIRVLFKEPQPAITPGQVLGVYDLTDTYIMGGGWIN